MSLGPFILKSESGRYTLAAYLSLAGIFSLWLSQLISDDLVEGLSTSIPVVSLLVVILLFARLEEALINPLVILFGRRTSDMETANLLDLIRISQLPFLRHSKDAALGSTIFGFTLALLTQLVWFFPEFTDFLPWSTSVTTVIVVGLVGLMFLVSLFRILNYLIHLEVLWRFNCLHKAPRPQDEVKRQRIDRLEQYLNLGAWEMARNLLRQINREIAKTLTDLSHGLEATLAFIEWCDDPVEEIPVTWHNVGYAQTLDTLGFRCLESRTLPSIIDQVDRFIRPVGELGDKVRNLDFNQVPKAIEEKRIGLDVTRELLPSLIDRVEHDQTKWVKKITDKTPENV